MREKLIELFRGIAHENCFGSIEKIVDYLIANGVTVQKWVSVKDRLPIARKMIDGEQYYKTVAVRIAGSEVEAIAYYDQDEKRWFGTDDFPILEKVTYWYELPEWDLPQPPKGETIYCKDCENLMFSDCYGECAKGHKGIVNPHDTCKHAKRKPPKGE